MAIGINLSDEYDLGIRPTDPTNSESYKRKEMEKDKQLAKEKAINDLNKLYLNDKSAYRKLLNETRRNDSITEFNRTYRYLPNDYDEVVYNFNDLDYELLYNLNGNNIAKVLSNGSIFYHYYDGEIQCSSSTTLLSDNNPAWLKRQYSKFNDLIYLETNYGILFDFRAKDVITTPMSGGIECGRIKIK
jgi:hypothetical protein